MEKAGQCYLFVGEHDVVFIKSIKICWKRRDCDSLKFRLGRPCKNSSADPWVKADRGLLMAVFVYTRVI